MPFVEVTLGTFTGNNDLGWDTHQQNFENVKKLSAKLDGAWATLDPGFEDQGTLRFHADRLDGRIRPDARRSTARGAATTSPGPGRPSSRAAASRAARSSARPAPDGQKVVDRPVSVPDFMSTVCRAIGLDPMKQNISNVGRPIRLADPDGKPIKEILA